jgi:hypothetical protein
VVLAYDDRPMLLTGSYTVRAQGALRTPSAPLEPIVHLAALRLF